MSVVFDFNDSFNDFAPVSPISLSVDVMKMEKSGLLMDVSCVSSFFLLSSPPRSISVSVVFDFNASLSDFAPVYPMLLPVDVMRMEERFVDGCLLRVFLLLSSHPRLSSVSVVFDFNDSFNDVAPVSPILFPDDIKRMEMSELLMDVFCVSSFFCLHHPDRVS